MALHENRTLMVVVGTTTNKTAIEPAERDEIENEKIIETSCRKRRIMLKMKRGEWNIAPLQRID